ncbi:VOC family protein [Streptomyces sp. NPDC005963]|uniref:VOC family protein n=1 Tax=Streptomyces sp. NPDC005963 TaxID=3156721 RepID=UPI003409AEDA
MTEATRRTPGTPCWVSLMVHGLDEIQMFYGELFGWEFSPGPGQLGPYVRGLLDGKEVAGIGRLPADRQLPIAWTPYLWTDDADATAELVRCSGGTVGVGPLDAADAGRMAIVTDPAGAVFGLWQPASHHGISLHGTHGTPVWHELLTSTTSSVSKFYETVFGYEIEKDTPAEPEAGSPQGEENDRVTLLLDGRAVAALHGVGRTLSRRRGTAWMTYFQVEDTDRSASQVIELGGQVITPPSDGPHGRTATVSDPEGAVFTLVRQRS